MKQIINVQDVSAKHRMIDARFRHEAGLAKTLFLESHIPGASYVDMETQLSGPKTGFNGRHPLPDKSDLINLFSDLGIDHDTHLVVYDDADHAGAARLWMLLKWLGHNNVQVLNGGLSAWKKAGLPTESGAAKKYERKEFKGNESLVKLLFNNQLENQTLVDARAPERYRGEVEPLDPIAGHIPGAKNIFYKTLFDKDGLFISDEDLRRKLIFLNPIYYCGSGVTAAVLLLASHHVGLAAGLYPGSWSEWCKIPNAKIEK